MERSLLGLDGSSTVAAMSPTKRSEYAAATKRDLVEVGRRLFADRGYAGTSLDHVVAEAGVTKGALYHHFENKKELFAAVAERVEAELTATIGQGSERDPWRAMISGAERYLDAALEPEVQNVLLIDAPTVLGYDRWHELQARYGLGLTRAGLENAMDAGLIAKRPSGPLANMVLSALSAGAMFIARAEDRKAARRHVGEIALAMLEGLKT
jgi:AcrR family transcriptional regulator